MFVCVCIMSMCVCVLSPLCHVTTLIKASTTDANLKTRMTQKSLSWCERNQYWAHYFFHNEKVVCVTLLILILVHGPLLFGNFLGCPLYSSQHAGSAQVFWVAFSRKANKFDIIDNKQRISRLIKSTQDKHCKISFLLDVTKESDDFKILPVCQRQIKKSTSSRRTELITSWKRVFQNNNLHGVGFTVALIYKQIEFL